MCLCVAHIYVDFMSMIAVCIKKLVIDNLEVQLIVKIWSHLAPNHHHGDQTLTQCITEAKPIFLVQSKINPLKMPKFRAEISVFAASNTFLLLLF